jgi:glucose/arabinose dehydrogenase
MTSMQDSAFYGWPYRDHGQNLNTRVEQAQPALVSAAVKPDDALGPHTAPLGLAHPAGNLLPAPFAEGMFIGQHGSRNRRPHSG